MAEIFRGLHYPIALDKSLGWLHKERDYEQYISQLIRQVLLTVPGERIDRPDFGAGLRRLLFAPSSEDTATLLQATVFQSLDRWLGDLIDVNEVTTSFADGRMDVNIVYTIKTQGELLVLNLEVTL